MRGIVLLALQLALAPPASPSLPPQPKQLVARYKSAVPQIRLRKKRLRPNKTRTQESAALTWEIVLHAGNDRSSNNPIEKTVGRQSNSTEHSDSLQETCVDYQRSPPKLPEKLATHAENKSLSAQDVLDLKLRLR